MQTARFAHLQRALKNSRIFRCLPDEFLPELASLTTVTAYRDGEYLWRTGDDAASFSIVQAGLVEIRRATAHGGDTIVGLFGPRESLDNFSTFDTRIRGTDAIAVSDKVELLRVRAAPVLEALRRLPTPCQSCRPVSMAAAMQTSMAIQLGALEAKIDIMSAGTVEQRLALLILHLLDRFGDEDETHALHIPVALSRGQMARYVGARVETVIRTLSQWKRSGWIESFAGGFRFASTEPFERICAGDGAGGRHSFRG